MLNISKSDHCGRGIGLAISAQGLCICMMLAAIFYQLKAIDETLADIADNPVCQVEPDQANK